jgi:glutamate N-acetyltransferase/amino-acid N-acetyltransferase
MATAVANEFSVPENEVIMSSTGIIGRQLDIELIEKGIKGLSEGLSEDPIVGAKGIITTDRYPKSLSLYVGDATVTIVGKGSGMIEPNMATMLVYIFTDAEIEADTLDSMLKSATNNSFNMLSVDTDTSTSDTCVIMANGLAGKVDNEEFYKILEIGCSEMTKMLARDGEGATKLLTASISGAKDNQEAKYIAKAMINSPLIKTMAYGADPNIGRVLMVLGKCFECDITPEKIEVKINDTLVYKDMTRVDFDEAAVRTLLSGDEVDIEVHLGAGEGNAVAYGCDLTEGYIEENAAYYSS